MMLTSLAPTTLRQALVVRASSATCSSSHMVRFCSRSYATQSASTTTPNPSEPTSPASASTSLPSAAPPGTILTGLSIYKDKPDPVVLEDSAYPPWLFALLDDPSIASSSSAANIELAGMSKGEARAAVKRQAKMLRASQVAKAKAEAAQAEKNANASSSSESGSLSAEEQEKLIKKALRKQNKEKIKARNFVSAS